MKNKKRHIFLVGFMGSGKTTVGELLAKKMGLPFHDTDKMIEEQVGEKIPSIFKNRGEQAFRDYERDILKKIVSDISMPSSVIATGGGMPCFGDNMDVMKEHGITIYLKTDVNDILKRIDDAEKRPIFKNEMKKGDLLENIENLLIKRELCYGKSDIVIYNDSGKTPLNVVEELIEKLRNMKNGNY